MIPSQISFNTLPVNATYASETTVDTQKFSDILYSAGCSLKDLAYLSRCLASIHPTIAKNIYETENLSDQKLLHIDCRSTNEIKINIFFGQQREGLIEINSDTVIFSMLSSLIDSAISKFQHQIPVNGSVKEGANKRGNSSRLTQSFHFFMFEPIFSPVNALNQPI